MTSRATLSHVVQIYRKFRKILTIMHFLYFSFQQKLILILQHNVQPPVLLLFIVSNHREAVIHQVQGNGKLVFCVRLLVDVKTFMQGYGTLRRMTGLELFLTVVVIKTCRTTAACRAEYKVLFLHRLKTELNRINLMTMIDLLKSV